MYLRNVIPEKKFFNHYFFHTFSVGVVKNILQRKKMFKLSLFKFYSTSSLVDNRTYLFSNEKHLKAEYIMESSTGIIQYAKYKTNSKGRFIFL